MIIPILDNVVAVIDERIQTTAFNAQEALTRDTVPVNVDAIIFWHVHDAQKAALAITDYRQAIDRVAQTSLREMIGSSMLATLLSDRKAADEHLAEEIGRKTADWGITVRSVETRDVAIPVALQDSMSRQAQAEREKQARVILGSAEAEVAAKFVEASKVYENHPSALQLRAMNIIYETTKERGATILIPSSMVGQPEPRSGIGNCRARRDRFGFGADAQDSGIAVRQHVDDGSNCRPQFLERVDAFGGLLSDKRLIRICADSGVTELFRFTGNPFVELGRMATQCCHSMHRLNVSARNNACPHPPE